MEDSREDWKKKHMILVIKLTSAGHLQLRQSGLPVRAGEGPAGEAPANRLINVAKVSNQVQLPLSLDVYGHPRPILQVHLVVQRRRIIPGRKKTTGKK